MARTKVIDDQRGGSSNSLTVRTNADLHYVRLNGAVAGVTELDAAGVGVLVGALTQWLVDRADRL